MAKSYSEADAGSMKGYDPNLGLPKRQVANSGYTPKSGPMAPQARPKQALGKVAPMRGEIAKGGRQYAASPRRFGGAQGNAMSTQMTAGMRKGQSAFNRLLKK